MMRFLTRLVLAIALTLVVLLLALRISSALRETDATVPPEGRTITTDMGGIYLEELGPKEGPPVLLIHGSVGWARMWHPTQEVLEQAGYRAIAFDMPPMGYSDRPTDGDYARETQAQRVLALIRALKIRPVLVAHSFGAGAAAEAAMRAPEVFAGLVVVDGAIGLGSHEKLRDMPLPLRPAFLREIAISATATNPWATNFLLRKFLYRKDAARSRIDTMLQAPFRRVGFTAALADWVPTLLIPPMGARSTHPEAWRNLALPAAFIWGDKDTTTPLEQGTALATLARAPIIVLPEVGHIPQIEDPAAFHAALLQALDGLAPK